VVSASSFDDMLLRSGEQRCESRGLHWELPEMLTAKQRELLLFIHEKLQDGGISPSFDEMKDALGLKSKSGIHRLINGLEERGFLRRLAHRARALEVVRLPDGLEPAHFMRTHREEDGPTVEHDPSEATPVIPLGSRRTTSRQNSVANQNALSGGGAVVGIPLYGRIAAGLPIEAVADHTQFADVPASLLGNGEHYALEVSGQSMIEEGIRDGDTVVIRRCDSAEDGAIVVALVDDEEVTLKTLQRRQGRIALIPANPEFETRLYEQNRVRVQGRLVGLIRRY